MIVESKTVDILLVEDNAEDAELAMAALKARKMGNRALHLLGGEQVIDFICANSWSAGSSADNAPKLILLDLQLSGMSGLEVLQQIKVREKTRPIPVVVFTGSESKLEMWASYRLGANGYVVKPVEPKEYAKVVGDIAYYWLEVNRSYY